jgi:cytochrome P450
MRLRDMPYRLQGHQRKKGVGTMQEISRAEPVKLGGDFYQKSWEVYALLREQGPVREVVLPNGLPGWLVTSYDDARALLADPRLSKDHHRTVDLLPPEVAGRFTSPLNAHMLMSDPPDHTRLRKLVTKAFTSRTVEGLRPRIEQVAAGLLDAMPAGAAVDLLSAYALPLPIAVISEMLGVPEADRGRFRDWTLSVLTDTTPEVLVENSLQQTTVFLTGLIEDKRAHPGDDLISQLVQVSDNGDQLSDHELLTMSILLLGAGFETTVNLIGNAVLSLLRHPGQLALLRSDPTLLPGAVEEFLRHEGPVNIATERFTTEPVRVGGMDIPADQFVLISLLAANRDERRFADPDRLDITRPPSAHLAFGHGVHHCLGAPLARLEGQIAIGALLRRFPGLTLAAEPEDLRWRESILIRGLHELPVRLGRSVDSDDFVAMTGRP